MGNKPQLYKFADIEHRLHTLEQVRLTLSLL